ncbi:MAG TPA: hydrogenase 4 subunit B [Candidatus Acidoferrales bacterium]|nr:hydrogenase 4 subunit B [Candidatus Acidoferrales bacterium]
MPGAGFWFAAALAAYLLGAIAGLACWRRPADGRRIAFGLALAGSLLLAAAAAGALAGGKAVTWTLPVGVTLFPWTARLDPLSAFFTLTLALLAIAVSIYSLGYLKEMEAQRNVGILGFFYNLVLLSLALVFTAANAFFFLIAWELMSITAFCLVTFEHEKPEARRAAVLFLVMSHAGTGLLLAGFLILGALAGSVDFARFHLLASTLSPFDQGFVFLLFFLGFGVKAGVVPLHIWLPDAHPVAPSNISALMSGIVIKTGIYGMARVFFDFYGPPPLWMGTLVLAAGVVTALVGVLCALMEHDIKRLLAYHSIENIGIILMGFGAALMFRALDHAALAAMALVAALFHTMNHAIFKGLLFLAAGSVVQATRTRNMEQMGGLVRRMPATALFFLVGAVAISGLPPLNGFVSEWLTYQALLAGFGTTQSLTRVMFPVAGSLLALTAALAAACFVKAFGIPFLALPRSQAAANAGECSHAMQVGMGLLAAACFVLGLAATWIFPMFDPITQNAFGVNISSTMVAAGGLALRGGSPHAGTVSTFGIALVFAALVAATVFLVGRRMRQASHATGPSWDCGLPGLTADNQFTAAAFSKPLRMIFAAFYRPRQEIQPQYDVSPYYPSAIHFESEVEPLFERHTYDPVERWIFGLAKRMRAIQAGSVHAYLAYIFVALILLLLFGVRS